MRKFCIIRLLTACLCAGWSQQLAVAQELGSVESIIDAPEDTHLFGDLGRGELEDRGYKLEVLAVHDFWGNAKGGKYRGVGVMGNMNLMLTVDTAQAGFWDNGQFLFWGIGVYGRRPSLAVGDYQYTSSIDAFDTFEPYEMYYQHFFADKKINVLAGVHDFTLEFAVLNYGFTFINSSFFTPSTITQIPYSFYPTTGLGARVFSQLSEEVYLLAGIYDGRPTDPNRLRAIDWGLSSDDGAYTIAETGWVEDNDEQLYGKLALGAWHNSGKHQDINGTERGSNFGGYLLGERELWREQDGSDQGLGSFVQVGYAEADRNFNPWYFGGGVRYKGAFTGRDEDVLGLGYTHAQIGSKYRSANECSEKSERVVELSYRMPVTPSVVITPDIQYVTNPSFFPGTPDALIFYFRTEIGL